MPRAVEPTLAVEIGHLHDQRIALPAAARDPEPELCLLLERRARVGRDHAVAGGAEHDDLARLLNDFHLFEGELRHEIKTIRTRAGVQALARLAGPAPRQTGENLVAPGHRPGRVGYLAVRWIGDEGFLGRCGHVDVFVVFQVAEAVASGGAPHALEVGHAFGRTRRTVGREQGFLGEPCRGHGYLRRILPPEGLPGCESRRQKQDLDRHRQCQEGSCRRRDGCENSMSLPMAHSIARSDIRCSSNSVFLEKGRFGVVPLLFQQVRMALIFQ